MFRDRGYRRVSRLSEFLCGGNSPCEIFGAKLPLADHTFTTGPSTSKWRRALKPRIQEPQPPGARIWQTLWLQRSITSEAP